MRAAPPLSLMVLLAFLSACSGQEKGASPSGDIVEVGYVVARATNVPLTRDYTGRAVAYQTGEVRPQVSGVIKDRLFTEGQMVQAGQSLYQIDPSLYDAAVREAQASLETARATKVAADALVERYRPLAQIDAVSRQDFVNAIASARQAGAAVGQAAARLDTARISRRFATVPAPLSGRIGRSLVTVGGLAMTGQSDPLAVIQQIDPLFVDVQQSAAELTELQRSIRNGATAATGAAVQIIQGDGSVYAHPGSIAFSDITVDQSTGTVTLRVRLPNPDGLLLPGTFVRARIIRTVQPGAILVPQEALRRDAGGDAVIWLVGAGNKAVRRVVVADRTEGNNWVVTGGLKPGEKVIVQGVGNMRADASLRPVPAATPEQIGPASPPPAGGRR